MSKVQLYQEPMVPSMQNVDGEIEIIVADLGALTEWLVDQINICYELGLEPDFVLMGTEEFSQVTKTVMMGHMASFNLGFDIFDRRGKFRDISFRVAPNITGMCMVPKQR